MAGSEVGKAESFGLLGVGEAMGEVVRPAADVLVVLEEVKGMEAMEAARVGVTVAEDLGIFAIGGDASTAAESEEMRRELKKVPRLAVSRYENTTPKLAICVSSLLSSAGLRRPLMDRFVTAEIPRLVWTSRRT